MLSVGAAVHRPGQPVQHRLDDVVPMPCTAVRRRAAAAPSSAPGRSLDGHAASVRTVARCAQLVVNRGAALAASPAARRSGRRRPRRPVSDAGRLEELAWPIFLYAARRDLRPAPPGRPRSGRPTLNRFSVSIAWMTTSASASFASGAIVVRERPVARLVERLAGADRLDAHPRIRIPQHGRAPAPASSAPSPSSVQSAWKRASRFGDVRTICCSAGTTDRSCFSTSSCCAVSRHQPFGCERCATSCAAVSFSMRGCVDRAPCRRRSAATSGRGPAPCPADTARSSSAGRCPASPTRAPSIMPRYMSTM